MPGASAFLLSILAHALLIGGVVWLVGIPKKPAPVEPIRISLFAPGGPGLRAGRTASPAPAKSPVRVPRASKIVAPLHKTRVSRRKKVRKKVTRAHAISRRAETAVVEKKPPAQPSEREAKNASGTGNVTSGEPAGGHKAGEESLGLASAGPFPAGTVAHPPRILKRVLPVYPLRARVRGIAGRVVVEVIIGRDGGIRNIKVVRSIAFLDKAAVRAVRQWRFSPARNADGTPVSVIVDIPVIFTLQG